MTRRHLLRALLALPIAATLDVEQLLWTPGQMVVVPGRGPWFGLAEANEILKAIYLPAVREMFNRSTVLLSLLSNEPVPDIVGREFTIPLRSTSSGLHLLHG
jgi:hypothetical protein